MGSFFLLGPTGTWRLSTLSYIGTCASFCESRDLELGRVAVRSVCAVARKLRWSEGLPVSSQSQVAI